ncbi:MAG: aminotransferase class I/II-fold pyridoxal phosphate-dependent enzyme [Chitinophagaceae bacterium]|nr:MAG: aminotransferase class I/II-fold pyridoxal phosphate-dependent enzyme [Chitinophagaceae bacterium]
MSVVTQADSYGQGGPVAALEKKFEILTGKQKAIYMPTGTMANQLAIAALSGSNTKVFVQETSHVYRDEADAAQSVHNKRLIPLAKGEAAFTLEDLRKAIEYHNNGEVFKSGIGAVSIENPVRRSNGAQVPFDEIKKISAWCRSNNIKVHLDGARLFLAAAYSNIPIRDYCNEFDTVYISLYKYFGATGGAILCGDQALIESMEHQVKIFGGTMYQSWPQASMALHYLDGFEKRFQSAVLQSGKLFEKINTLADLKILPWTNGSNIYQMKFSAGINTKKFSDTMNKQYGILISGFLRDGIGRLAVNESILHRDIETLFSAFEASLSTAKN